MPVHGLGWHWLWGNWQPEPLSLGVPVLCRHAWLINVKPITAQEKFNFPRVNAILACAQALLWVRDCHAASVLMRGIHPLIIFKMADIQGGMPLISTLARMMNHGVAAVTPFWLSSPSVCLYSVIRCCLYHPTSAVRDQMWGGIILMYWNKSQCTIERKTTLFSRGRLYS
jgi:hypothetical protein